MKNVYMGFFIVAFIAIAFLLGTERGEYRTERKFLKRSLITPPAEWSEQYGDSLRSRQVWNSAAMANDLKKLQAEQKELDKKINKKADK